MKKHSNREAYEKKKVSVSTGNAVPLKTEGNAQAERKTEPVQKIIDVKPEKMNGGKRPQPIRGRMLVISGIIVVAVVVLFVALYSTFGGKGEFSASFTVNSSTATLGKNTITLEHPVLEEESVAIVPIVDVAEILPISVHWKEGKDKATIKGNGSKIKLTVDKKTVIINGEEVKWNYAPTIDDKTLYVPLTALCAALGYQTSYVESVQKIHVFPKDDDNKAPLAEFTIDKDTYETGETVQYSVNATDPDGDDIAEYKWENYQETYDEPGEYDITLKVMDVKGAWSEEVSKTITIKAAAE